MVRWLFPALVALVGCPPSGDPFGVRVDDDDATGDDDDATGDDDDASGDDDDSSAGDDDDSTAPPADDDDSTAPPDDDDDDDDDGPYLWEGDVFCLDWSTVTWNEPPAAALEDLGFAGMTFTESSPLLNPLLAIGDTLDLRLGASQSGSCAQDLSSATLDDGVSWSVPSFQSTPIDFVIPSVVGVLTVHNARVGGEITTAGDRIIDGTLTGGIEVPGFAANLCGLVVPCVPCPGAGFLDCVALDVEDATWNNVGAGPLTIVP